MECCKYCDCFYDVRLGEQFISQKKLLKYDIKSLKQGAFCMKYHKPVLRSGYCDQFEIYHAQNEKELAYALRMKMKQVLITKVLYKHLFSLASSDALRILLKDEAWQVLFQYAPCFVDDKHSLSHYYHKQVQEPHLPFHNDKLKTAMVHLSSKISHPNCIYSLCVIAYYGGGLSLLNQLSKYQTTARKEDCMLLEKCK